eukprot:CAMPEP_0203869716 /NCGR_PEP_ID=MMETSP0359-20131031/17871_1 /ASSEMBLY_ACC=CAM_ASM_000338 /TAXON_ID=268821 /ORGANISM="Scrippsiella Hangoei, Strain SHTV-5" /LENGTH=132 /DNA_ID=CAMNT_0050788375 /DNA_START=137 /DNA_END=532 /DNA_ORIENTATION=-
MESMSGSPNWTSEILSFEGRMQQAKRLRPSTSSRNLDTSSSSELSKACSLVNSRRSSSSCCSSRYRRSLSAWSLLTICMASCCLWSIWSSASCKALFMLLFSAMMASSMGSAATDAVGFLNLRCWPVWTWLE